MLDIKFTAQVWEIVTGKTVYVLRGHTRNISDTTFSLDGKYIFTTSNDKTVKVWDIDTGLELCNFTANNPLQCVAADQKDAKRLVVGDAQGHLYWLQLLE